MTDVACFARSVPERWAIIVLERRLIAAFTPLLTRGLLFAAIMAEGSFRSQIYSFSRGAHCGYPFIARCTNNEDRKDLRADDQPLEHLPSVFERTDGGGNQDGFVAGAGRAVQSELGANSQGSG